MPDRYLIFADGGDEKGFGHLSRMKTLVSNLDIKDQSVVLYETQGQKSFWKENNFLHAYPKNEISKFLKHQLVVMLVSSSRSLVTL